MLMVWKRVKVGLSDTVEHWRGKVVMAYHLGFRRLK